MEAVRSTGTTRRVFVIAGSRRGMTGTRESVPERLDGYTALVTGGAGTVGVGVSMRLAREGANVVVAQRSREAPDELVDRIEAEGGRASYVRTDLTDEGEIADVVAATVETYGGLEILVNNAVNPWKEPAESMTRARWEAVIETNLTAPFRLAQHAYPHMREAGYGRVINVGAIQGRSPLPGAVAYASSKTGLEGMTRSLASEWGGEDADLTANVVMVGPVYEDPDRSDRPDLPIDEVHERVPPEEDERAATLVGRWGRPSDVGATVAFLAAPESGFVTAAVLPCDGGRLVSRAGRVATQRTLEESDPGVDG